MILVFDFRLLLLISCVFALVGCSLLLLGSYLLQVLLAVGHN